MYLRSGGGSYLGRAVGRVSGRFSHRFLSPHVNEGGTEGSGFALVEVIVASAIAVVAVLGLAYSFSVGRAQIDRFKIARVALATAQDQMERLTTLSPTDPSLTIGEHPASPPTFVSDGVTLNQSWKVEWFDDPAISGSNDLKRVTVEIAWTQGPLSDALSLTRLFPQ